MSEIFVLRALDPLGIIRANDQKIFEDIRSCMRTTRMTSATTGGKTTWCNTLTVSSLYSALRKAFSVTYRDGYRKRLKSGCTNWILFTSFLCEFGIAWCHVALSLRPMEHQRHRPSIVWLPFFCASTDALWALCVVFVVALCRRSSFTQQTEWIEILLI